MKLRPPNFHIARKFANDLSERQVEIFRLSTNRKHSFAHLCTKPKSKLYFYVHSVVTPVLQMTNITNLVLFLHVFHPVPERFKAWPEVRVFLPALQHDSVPENRDNNIQFQCDQFRSESITLVIFCFGKTPKQVIAWLANQSYTFHGPSCL